MVNFVPDCGSAWRRRYRPLADSRRGARRSQGHSAPTRFTPARCGRNDDAISHDRYCATTRREARKPDLSPAFDGADAGLANPCERPSRLLKKP